MPQQAASHAVMHASCNVAETASASRARAFACEIVDDLAGMREIVADWRRLQDAGGQDTQGFQTLQWCLAWAEVFLTAGTQPPRRPCLLLLRDVAGDPLLLWPLMRERYPLRLEVYTWLTDPFGQYGDIVTVLQGEALQRALAMALDTLASCGGDLVRLRHVRADAAIAPFLRRHFCRAAENLAAPFLDLSAYDSPEALDRRLNKTQRRRRRKSINGLKRHFGEEPTFRILHDEHEAALAIARALHHKRQWLRHKGLISRTLFCERSDAFFRRLAAHAATGSADDGKPRLVVSVTQARGEQLSWELAWRYRGRHYAYLTARLPEMDRYSIGRLHMTFSQRHAFTEGVHTFDLLVPDAPHKRTWSSGTVPVHDYFLPLSTRGRLLGQGYLNHLRPFMRDIYHRIPPHIRRMLRLSEMTEHDHGMG